MYNKNKLDYIINHPVLSSKKTKFVTFYYNGIPYKAYDGDMITSALAAHGIYNIGKNSHDHTAQGLFCANGMCSQCRILADGLIVKGCMTPISEGVKLTSITSIPPYSPEITSKYPEIIQLNADVVIIGGGPSGMATAITIAEKSDLKILLVDDKPRLGGKLLLQTHKFFGSVADCYAGTRGLEIARILESEIQKYKNIKVMTDSYLIGAFSNKKVGIFNQKHYYIVETSNAILCTGAREKFLSFKGNNLPGIFGAGAFQTLLNRDLVKGSSHICIVGAGNVGLIAAYHALQAGIAVDVLIDTAAKPSGYKVHCDKIKRFGVPILFRYGILEALGNERVEKIVISPVNELYQPLYKDVREYKVDTVLIAVGLQENNEIENSFKQSGIHLYKAGDANEIAEASSAMFSGKLSGLKLLKDIGYKIGNALVYQNNNDTSEFDKQKLNNKNFGSKEKVPQSDEITADTACNKYIENSGYTGCSGYTSDEDIQRILEKEKVLKSPGGKVFTAEEARKNKKPGEVYPSIFCYQQIPCNPCVSVCPTKSIAIDGDPIYDLPYYNTGCIGCGKCVLICPGLAITLVKKENSGKKSMNTILDKNVRTDMDSVINAVSDKNHHKTADQSTQKATDKTIVIFPSEYLPEQLPKEIFAVTDCDGAIIGEGTFHSAKYYETHKRTLLSLVVDEKIADKAAGFRLPVYAKEIEYKKIDTIDSSKSEGHICICERVTEDEVRQLIKMGIRDINFIKAATRLSMGACGGKTCSTTIMSLFREQSINRDAIEPNNPRPLLVEVPFKYFAGAVVDKKFEDIKDLE